MQTHTLLPSGSASTVNDGASESSTTVPPAATAAAMRASATSGATHRSRCQRWRGTSCGSVPWNHIDGSWPVGSKTVSATTPSASPVSTAAQNGPSRASSAVSRASSTWLTSPGTEVTSCRRATSLSSRARVTSSAVTQMPPRRRGGDPQVDVGGGQGGLEVVAERGLGGGAHGIRDERGADRGVSGAEPRVQALGQLAPVGEVGVDDVLGGERAPSRHPATAHRHPAPPQLSRPVREPSPSPPNRSGAKVKVPAPGEKVGTTGGTRAAGPELSQVNASFERPVCSRHPGRSTLSPKHSTPHHTQGEQPPWHVQSASTSAPPTAPSPSSRAASPPSSRTPRAVAPPRRSSRSARAVRCSSARSPSARPSRTPTAPSARSSATWAPTGAPTTSTARSTTPRRSAPASCRSSSATRRPTSARPSRMPSSPSPRTSTTTSARPPRRPARSRA